MSAPTDKVEYGDSANGASSPPLVVPEAVAVATLQPSYHASDNMKMTGTNVEEPMSASTMMLTTSTTSGFPNTTMPVMGSSATTEPYNSNGVAGTSVVVGGSSAATIPMSQQRKVGAKCCGCCCDYRRAVVVVAILFIVSTTITLILSIIGASVPGADNIDDDQIEEIAQTSTIRIIIVSAIGLVMAVGALFGARMYSITILSVVVVWYVVRFGIGIWFDIDTVNAVNEVYRQNGKEEVSISPFFYVVNGIITALWVYPHIGLILEIKNGIMSVETYPREEYSCCCTDNHNNVHTA